MTAPKEPVPTPRPWFIIALARFTAAEGRRFRRLTDAAQLTLIYVYAAACLESPEATWPDEDALADALVMLGRKRDTLPPIIADLKKAGYLERDDDDGAVLLPEWDAEQFAASHLICRALENDRAARGRASGTWRKPSRNKAKKDTPNPFEHLLSTLP